MIIIDNTPDLKETNLNLTIKPIISNRKPMMKIINNALNLKKAALNIIIKAIISN